jgi:Mlc titration factor MtfA (ptsG expression regulator)
MLSKLTHWLGTRRRERALRDYAIDDSLWQATLDGLPFLAHLDAPDLVRLRELTSLFLAQKEFSTAHELELTDAMTVAIAAQACLPVLNLSLDLYLGWVGVIVYPGEFVIRKTVEDEDGVVHEVEQDASGEAWEGGPVVLSWEDAQMTDGTDAYNVVIHEFAHKIDMLNGEADGHPPLMRRWHAPLDAQARALSTSASIASVSSRGARHCSNAGRSALRRPARGGNPPGRAPAARPAPPQ